MPKTSSGLSKLTHMHGNYCGPYWSAGKFQKSVVSDVPPIDEFDETCKRHDAVYARDGDLQEADKVFFRENIGRRGLLRNVAATAVGLQAGIRGISHGVHKLAGRKRGVSNKSLRVGKVKMKEIYHPEDDFVTVEIDNGADIIDVNYGPGGQPHPRESKLLLKNNLIRNKMPHIRKPRKIVPIEKVKPKGTHQRKATQPVNIPRGTVPVNSMQTFVKSDPTVVSKAGRHGETISGSVYLTSLLTATKLESSLEDLALQAIVPLNPGNFGNSMLSNVSRFYEQFRFRKLRLHYLTSSATTTAGTVVLSHQVDSLNEVPSRGYKSSDLYSNLFSRENTLMGPVWDNAFMDVPKEGLERWCFTDSKFGHTVEDLFSGYLLAYSTIESGVPGRLVLEFVCEFKGRANEIGDNIPRPMTTIMNYTISSKTAGDIAQGDISGGITVVNETIVMFYMDSATTTYGTGSALDDLFTLKGEHYHAGYGAPLYVKQYVDSNPARMYVTLESAIGDTNPLTMKNTTTTDTILEGLAFVVINDSPEISNL